MQLNSNALSKLTKELKIKPNSPIIQRIQQSPTLVNLLNTYKQKYVWLNAGSGSAFDGKDELKLDGAHLININNGQYDAFLTTLAHELGHATGVYQTFYIIGNTPQEYSTKRMKGEGEAIYYEWLVGQELGLGTTKQAPHFNSLSWLDGSLSEAGKNYHTEIIAAFKNRHIIKDKEKIVDDLAKLNATMIGSGMRNSQARFTYDEANKWGFITNRKDMYNFQADYKEVFGVELSMNTYLGKTLVNRKNNFFGIKNNETETIENKHTGGTAIAKKYGFGDLLYGGKGKDIIKGNTGKDIIIGGDDVDTLHGHAGDDILGGNQGDDHLYGGRGSDLLKGGVGNDTYHLIANDITNSNETDTIHDKDNQGKILIANVDISKAKWVNKGNGVFQAADQKWQLKLIDTDWEITGMNGSSLKSKIIVKDAALTATAFGLTLPKAASASSRSVSANEHAFLASSISAANNLISAMSAFGVDNVGMADDLNARSAQYHAPLLAASAI